MSISIYNYKRKSQEFTQEKATNAKLILNKFDLIKSKPLKVIEYVIKNKSTAANNSSSFKIKSVSNTIKLKRQKSRLRKKILLNETMLKTMHQRHHNSNQHNILNNRHFQHQPQQQQQQQQQQQHHQHQYTQSNQFNFNTNNGGMNHGQVKSSLPSNQFQFTGLTTNTFQGPHRRVFKSLNKSKSIKIARSTNNNGNLFQSQNKQFNFQSNANTTVPVTDNLSANANFTNIMSESFGVNPGVAAAAAAACATLAQLLRSELTINLAKDQPRLVISGPSNRQQTTQQQSNYLNCNRNFFRKRKFHSNFHNYHLFNFKDNNNNNNSNVNLLPQFMNQKSKLPTGQGQGHRFKYFKSGNFNNSLGNSNASANPTSNASTSIAPVNTSGVTERKQSMPLAINNGGKNKTAPYNTTQYIMHDYCKRRSFKDQVCPGDDFSDDWNNALKEAAANEPTASAVDSTTSSSNFFNFNFLNVNKSKLGDGLESGVGLGFLRKEEQPSSTTNDESNLVEIGKKLSRSVSYLSNNSNNIESIDMKDENENDLYNNSQEFSNNEVQFSSSL